MTARLLSAIRAARASASKLLPERGEVLEIGKGRVLREGSKVALLSLGTRLAEALKAADELGRLRHLDTVADAASPSRSTAIWCAVSQPLTRC